ncbi:unnamed protein product [Ectocarpus sp. 8 AP-2014]
MLVAPPPPPPPPPPAAAPAAPAAPAPAPPVYSSAAAAAPQPQQHPLAMPIAERIASMGPQELGAMRQLPNAQTLYPFIFEGNPGFGPFRDTLAGLVMPRLASGGGSGTGT